VADNVGIYNISGSLQPSLSSSLIQSLYASGSLNIRRWDSRSVLSELVRGDPIKATPTGARTVRTWRAATSPSWTQLGIAKAHGFVAPALSSSHHAVSQLNTFASGAEKLEATPVPASGAMYYSKASRFVRKVYKLSASILLPNTPGLETPPNPYEHAAGRGTFNSVSGSFRNSSIFNPTVFEIAVPDYGRIRDVKVWVEFIHDVRGGKGTLPATNGGTGDTGTFSRQGLTGIQIALRSPNVNFKFSHPLWNDPRTFGYSKNSDPAISASYQVVPELLKNSYLLWAGHGCEQDLAYVLGAKTASFPDSPFRSEFPTTSSAGLASGSLNANGNASSNLAYTLNAKGEPGMAWLQQGASGLFTMKYSLSSSVTQTWVIASVPMGAFTGIQGLGTDPIIDAAVDPYLNLPIVAWVSTGSVDAFGAYTSSLVVARSGVTGWNSPEVIGTAIVSGNLPGITSPSIVVDPNNRNLVVLFSSNWDLILAMSSSAGVNRTTLESFNGIIPSNYFGYRFFNGTSLTTDGKGNFYGSWNPSLFSAPLSTPSALPRYLITGSAGLSMGVIPVQFENAVQASNLGISTSARGATLGAHVSIDRTGTPHWAYYRDAGITKDAPYTTSFYKQALTQLYAVEIANRSGSGWQFQRTVDSPSFTGPASTGLAVTWDQANNPVILYVGPSSYLPQLQGVEPGAVRLVMSGADGYFSSQVVSRDTPAGTNAVNKLGLFAGFNSSSFYMFAGNFPPLMFYMNNFTGSVLGSSYFEYDNDVDMRTVFSDSSKIPNPRHLGALYQQRKPGTPGDSLTPFALLKMGLYPSPTSASTLGNAVYTDSFKGPDVNFGRTSCLTGSNWPWMADFRVSGSRLGALSLPNWGFDPNTGPTQLSTVQTLPPPGWLTGIGGVAAVSEFSSSGYTIGPKDIRPVYPIMDDVFVEKVTDDTPQTSATRFQFPSAHSPLVGFRPGLRGTEVNGRWQLLVGMAGDWLSASSSIAANPRAGIWFRQFRLEFLLDQGGPELNPITSKNRRFSKTTNVMSREGRYIYEIISGSAAWDVGINYVYVTSKPEYGRSIGITDRTGSANDSFAVFTRITGSLQSTLSAFPQYLSNEFGTPYIPLSSGSGAPIGFDVFTPEEIQASRDTFDLVMRQHPTISQANTLSALMSRLGDVRSTRDMIADRVLELYSGSV
jgi:hypothetical protein